VFLLKLWVVREIYLFSTLQAVFILLKNKAQQFEKWLLNITLIGYAQNIYNIAVIEKP